MYLLDTCALIWWSLDPKKLSVKAQEAAHHMLQTGGFVSSISIWEIGIKLKRKKLSIGLPLNQYLKGLEKTNIIEFLPVSLEVWMENLNLDWAHNDPADRTIVASAKLWNLKIITSDNVIRNFYEDTIW